MSDKPITEQTLLTELIAAYGLLNEAYWLALRQLKQGGVSVSDQWSFWEAVRALNVVDAIDDDLGFSAADPREDDTTRPDAVQNPFYLRGDALRDALGERLAREARG